MKIPRPTSSSAGEQSTSSISTQDQELAAGRRQDSEHVTTVPGIASQREGAEETRIKPTIEESFDKVLKEVTRYDEDLVKGWRDVINTLLVFLLRDSFEKWGVLAFLSALPILLEVASMLFFVGVLDLLWDRHCLLFLPALTVPGDQQKKIEYRVFNKLSYQLIRPYKSSQVWGVYYLFTIPRRWFTSRKPRRLSDYRKIPVDWPSFDLRVVRQFDKCPLPLNDSNPFSLKVYELCAFQWAVTMFQDSPSMIPHLQNLSGTMPTSLTMSAVPGEWKYTIWGDILSKDVELRLKDSRAFEESKEDEMGSYVRCTPSPSISDPSLHYAEGIWLLFRHQHWMAMAKKLDLRSLWYDFDNLIKSIDSDSHHAALQQFTSLRFVIPFPVVDVLWTHEDPTTKATQKAREVGNLPAGYFPPIPHWYENPLPSLAHIADASGIDYDQVSIEMQPPPNAADETGNPDPSNNEPGENGREVEVGPSNVAGQEDTGGGIDVGDSGADERV
ncbi:hypothetical protein WG66_013570 [Moniliophthora roreri]|uniref:DUF6535 domain-containing protein n=1 Tax=Moniliophthora roreri TaxID=221103 RepID=A0A0W0FST1_MONRR|nr:hypothetical protein WG66_013570 [Moniliophthora roreri]